MSLSVAWFSTTFSPSPLFSELKQTIPAKISNIYAVLTRSLNFTFHTPVDKIAAGPTTTPGSSLLLEKVSRFSPRWLQQSQINVVTGMILLFTEFLNLTKKTELNYLNSKQDYSYRASEQFK